MTVSEIINHFGGTSEMARLLDVPTSTVDSWRFNDFIPRWRQAGVLELAHRHSKPIGATDFPLLPLKKRRAEAA